MLVEFPSVVAATRCTVEVQRAMIDRNAGIRELRHCPHHGLFLQGQSG
jgi:hypothetical protein